MQIKYNKTMLRIKVIISLLLFNVLFSCNSSNNSGQQNIEKNLETTVKPDTLPFRLSSANNILFKALLNGIDTIDLYLDTGGTEIVLSHTAVKERTSLLSGKNKNYKGENYEPLEELNSLKIGKLSIDSVTIYPTSLIPKEADGHFGWNLFENNIVELDYDKKLMIVHATFNEKLDEYAKLEIEEINTLFCITGNLSIRDKVYSNRYLFDSGFQRAIIMDKELREEAHFPIDLPIIKESKVKNSSGIEFVNQVIIIDSICFNGACAFKVPVQLLSTQNPARFKTNILGNELLKRFNTVLDFQKGFVYMKPNSLMNLPYSDSQ